MTDSIRELEKIISSVYKSVDKRGQELLEDVKDGCHCCPATEWLGDVWFAFNKLLDENSIDDVKLENEVKSIVQTLDKHFSGKGETL